MREILWRRELLLQIELYTMSVLVLLFTPIIIATIFQLYAMFTTTGRRRILALLGFFIALFLVIPYSISTYGFLLFFSDAWFQVYGPIFWVLKGFSQLFLVLYSMVLAFPDFVNKHMWTISLPFIGFLAYVIATIFFLVAQLFQLHQTVFFIYNVIYILIIPLIATFFYLKLDRIRGTPRVPWILVITLGVIIWFIASATVFFVPQFLYHPLYFFPGVLVPNAMVGIGWWIILIGSLMDMRVGRQGSD